MKSHRAGFLRARFFHNVGTAPFRHTLFSPISEKFVGLEGILTVNISRLIFGAGIAITA
jgi:hypothetical protein